MKFISRFLLIAIALFAAACRRDDAHAIGAKQSPVIIITIDTLRSDHLPAYGYSHCPLTLVSHASLFTGLLPAEHGIRDNAGYELNKNVKTLAEMMKSKGY